MSARQLYKKADEVELSQPTPSFSRGVKPAWCRGPQEKCPHPQTGASFTDGFVVAVLPLSLPLPMSSNGMPEVPDREGKKYEYEDL